VSSPYSSSDDLLKQAERLILRLYVSGASAISRLAILNARSICECFTVPYSLEVVDVHQQPELAEAAGVVAVPVLVKVLPVPPQRIYGDLSDHEAVLAAVRTTSKSRT
jgi:circadian clock protein KaiB